MTKSQVRDVLLVEADRILNEAAKHAVQKLGKPVSQEARPGYLTDDDIAVLKEVGYARFDHPVVQKSMLANTARAKILAYPPKDVLSTEELDALVNLKLSVAESNAIQRLVAEACSATLFHFFCLMDSVADPDLMKIEQSTSIGIHQ